MDHQDNLIDWLLLKTSKLYSKQMYYTLYIMGVYIKA